MKTVLTTVVFMLLWSNTVLFAQEENQWVAAHGEEKYGTYCFTIRPDGRLLAFHTYYLLSAREDYAGWNIENEHPLMNMDCASTNPRGEVFVGVGGKGIWKYDDSNKTWENKSGTGTLSYITMLDIYINKQGHIYTCGTNLFRDKPIFRSRDNGESWQRVGKNLTEGDVISAIGVRQDGRMYVCGGTGIYRSDDSGETFTQVERWGDISAIYGEDVKVHQSGVVLVGSNGEGGLAWRSDTEGNNFFLLDKIKSVAAITIDSLGKIYVFAFSREKEQHYVYRSLDTGKTWQEYNSGRTGDGVNNVYDMITTPEGYVFTGGLSIHRTKYRQHNKPVFWGRTQSCNTVEFVVMDSIVTSVQILPPQSSNVRFEVLSPLGNAKVKIRLSLFDERKAGYFTLRAVNAEGMETLYSDTLQKIFPESVIRRDGDTLWGNGGYVYQWYRNGEKLAGERREFLVPVESGSYSVQVLNAYGCEQRSAEYSFVATSVTDNSSLHQNSLCSVLPNPSDGDVTIMYSVGERSLVRLVVVDALGRELGVVSTGVREAGEYSITWNGRNLSSGMYAVRLECGGQVYSLPLVIIK
jgi:photosystem II stability/assembly factor-like uncharacterized protein